MKENKNPPQIMYIIPNLFTASSCFFGILSIVASINANYEKAVIYIFISLLLDGLDGRVARMTKTTSTFGIEFDSLADIIAFGAAPAILFYSVIGKHFDKFGILATGIFVVFAAIRLARFNITTQSNEPNIFIGLPLPTAAIALSVWVKIYISYNFAPEIAWVYIVVAMILSLLMVSNIRYPSFKKINFNQTKFRQFLIISILVLSILYLRPIEFFAFVTTIYIFYGIIRALYNLYTVKFKKESKS